ncbi:hypothetical protein [Ensifer sp. LCM 4579]|uniref:hypothetical protein n=1 Tax=Ensifer sp. LCM 4579 TaxID=1848292 RepID=UPI0008DA8986|nr:hypothetical protein [Ensifer sp. LCM 4579]OHV78878.1 hypothetical protein LCM4579_24585 [Ensifer sp. LCM 4579]
MTKGNSEDPVGPVQAIWHALRGYPFEHYPQVSQDGVVKHLETGLVLERASRELSNLKVPAGDDALEAPLKLARQSLDEVKALTDYQDGKATRLLTIITFLSAFSGVLFNRFSDTYPLQFFLNGLSLDDTSTYKTAFVPLSYLLFAAFGLLAASGALVTFHAIRARFRYPRVVSEKGKPKSYVFFKPIAEVAPEDWSKAFLSTDPTKLRDDLQLNYLKNYITEAYLVATKVADKLRYLEPAQQLQSWAIKALILWLLALSITFIFVTPPQKDSNGVIRTAVTIDCAAGQRDAATIASQHCK